MESNQFYVWEKYWGELFCDNDSRFPSYIYGFENISQKNKDKTNYTFNDSGTLFGFVESGILFIKTQKISWPVSTGQWFCIPEKKVDLTIAKNSRVFITQRKDYNGLQSMGGPIESEGRLKYIDGCTDSLLVSPPLLGDPCLNLLHFPPEINQTMHTHPSSRTGIVASGEGFCVTENSEFNLKPGMIFYLPKNTKHNFKTEVDKNLNVISYHPDSDWGPTHELHPMINRTWVNGLKITE
jgi:quercetin dioxygenase-like cupin family protein